MSCDIPCPPPTQPPCPQICTPPPPLPPCRAKPVMRALHWNQTKFNLALAMALAAIGGVAAHFLVAKPRIWKYKDFYAKAEVEEWADEMARKGLFQSVPLDSLS